MPLRCKDINGNDIHSLACSDSAWSTLVDRNRLDHHLVMPCCGQHVVPKTSHRGIRFFAHWRRGNCTSAPETEVHLYLKARAYRAALICGWEATTETPGSTPSGKRWFADVLARDNLGNQVAVEIQWKNQTNDETLHRQGQYRESGVNGLWLFRHPGFPIQDDLPAVCIGGNIDEGFSAMVPFSQNLTIRSKRNSAAWVQILPMEDFLLDAFLGRFYFGVPLGVQAQIVFDTGTVACPELSCDARTRIVTFVVITVGPHRSEYSITDFTTYLDLWNSISQILSPIPEFSRISERDIGNDKGQQLSNGCHLCGAYISDVLLHWDETFCPDGCIAVGNVEVSHRWRELLLSSKFQFEWAVHRMKGRQLSLPMFPGVDQMDGPSSWTVNWAG